MPIHPTAIVDKRAEIDPAADIGPYAVIEGPVRVGPGTKVCAHAYLTGWTEIGANCEIYPGAVIGAAPQDLAYDGAESYCRIGDGTILREGSSIHRGTKPGTSTIIGQRCFFMANAHAGHNCIVGDDVILANAASLGGYVEVGNKVFISGGSMVHQFTRMGELAISRGLTGVARDLPPFFMSNGPNNCVGINLVGLRRAGFSTEERNEVRQAYRTLYRSGMTFSKAVDALAATVRTEPGKRLIAFLRAPSKRGFMAGPRKGHADSASED